MILYLAFVVACTKAAVPTEVATPETPGIEQAEVKPKVKVSGNLPMITQAELAKEDAARRACVEECIAARQAEAIAAEMIADQCQQGCIKTIPIRQVEVIPDIGDVQPTE